MAAENTRGKTTIYIGGLDRNVDRAVLHNAFIPFGDIVDISLPKPELPSNPDPHRGFGYVEFDDPADAVEAIDNMDQSELFGRVIKVSAAKPQQKNANEGLGSKTALWAQEGYLAKNAAESDDDLAAQNGSADPMQGLSQFDVAGPKAAA